MFTFILKINNKKIKISDVFFPCEGHLHPPPISHDHFDFTYKTFLFDFKFPPQIVYIHFDMFCSIIAVLLRVKKYFICIIVFIHFLIKTTLIIYFCYNLSLFDMLSTINIKLAINIFSTFQRLHFFEFFDFFFLIFFMAYLHCSI